HVLLRVRLNKIVILQTGDCQHRRAVQFCIIEAIQEVQATWTRSCKAHSELSGVLAISTRHESSRFFVTNLYESNFVRSLPERLHDSVDTVPRQTEYHLNAPIVNRINQNVGRRGFHAISPSLNLDLGRRDWVGSFRIPLSFPGGSVMRPVFVLAFFLSALL